eukprot:TRINITY_DN13791_c0_g1_i1.p1 TRINITY_DN13791_c0_g1~~TRINITY_DN13791_c0_g1_i1.p1  ORF type:complete len:352 (-),score=61.10 TRINITY_DN13791_c0_g1_i1:403-1458(-)
MSCKTIRSVKEVAESRKFTSIPSNFAFSQDEDAPLPDTDAPEIPTIDFSLLVNGTPDQRSQTIRRLGQASMEWGFFMVVNHSVEESLREKMFEVCKDFFDLPEAEKREHVGEHVLGPIRYGTSFNPSVEKIHYWRDSLKILVHPTFHSPEKPIDFRDVSHKFCIKIRELVKEVLGGISESLGLDGCYLEKASELNAGLQMIVANFYPPCPQPEKAMGMPPHTDHGLLAILMENNVGGLQVKYNGKWVLVNPHPNSFLVNVGDQLEILTNGKYKSVEHRAVVNNQRTRISVAIANGPSLGKAVSPVPLLVDSEHPEAYLAMTYEDYIKSQQSKPLDGRSCLDRVRLPNTTML